MPDAPRVHVGAMEGKGAYNRDAAIPASGAGSRFFMASSTAVAASAY
jgi:hypothetical protein